MLWQVRRQIGSDFLFKDEWNNVRLINADCFEALKDLADNSIDSVVSDPPYGLGKCSPAEVMQCLTAWAKGDTWKPNGAGFMGKAWDAWVPPPELWREVLRVLKPGGHALIFAGSRTQDLMGMSLRLAGFEMRDVVQWIYATGFPKSLDIGKATQDKRWDGWGTALKPAYEPALLVRKPLSGTVAQNILDHGCGGLNIDGSRIGSGQPRKLIIGSGKPTNNTSYNMGGSLAAGYTEQGRFPSNIIIDQVTAQQLDQQAGNVSRFFYCAKASKSEREAGLGDMPLRKAGAMSGEETRPDRPANHPMRANHHPTVKPIDLMRYLARLITPKGGIVLDPFMGSGSTGCACALEGFGFIGIERELEYFEIAQRRIKHWGGDGIELTEYPPEPKEAESETLPLFGWMEG